MSAQNKELTEDDEGYWYIHRHDLAPGQIFRLSDGSFVMLDKTVPGDGTKWYAADWHNGWTYYDNTIEPGDLFGSPLDAVAFAALKK